MVYCAGLAQIRYKVVVPLGHCCLVVKAQHIAHFHVMCILCMGGIPSLLRVKHIIKIKMQKCGSRVGIIMIY